ncbi:MAG: trehalose utilization protein ThuA [Phycisphaeraceae bacterium]|nr:trehalose utilization protein ThuA [Phycisphaeraceae bacterium]
MSDKPIRVTVWNEFRHERSNAAVKAIYPEGMHAVVAEALRRRLGSAVEVGTATLDEPDHGLTDEVLERTDVLTWWGHGAHHEVRDEIAEKVRGRVLRGMGLLPMHSGHLSKPFTLLMGTTCMLKWRDCGEREILWNVRPGHPITDGLSDHLDLPQTEMYGELFDIPEPDELIFISWFEGGNVFRSGCCFHRGKGAIFYFRPGHETFPIYHHDQVQRVLANAVRWLAPKSSSPYAGDGVNVTEPMAPIGS